MIELQNARINTAGAYICVSGLYVFAIGVRQHSGNIPVIRLGGHRENRETGWQCAVREVYEEANLQITPLLAPNTYLYDCDHMEEELQEVQWQRKFEQEPVPILVGSYCCEKETSLSLMYLAHAEGLPTPSSEVKGLLLLREDEIYRLCREPLTLEKYLNNGGKAVVNGDFDMQRVLEPFAQLRLLSRILSMRSKIKTT